MNMERAHASPTKDFFVSMITKDISLEDCVLDLLDNCIDGAMRLKKVTMDRPSKAKVYEGCCAEIYLSSQYLEIKDNCGGISLNDATDYAFHFGKRRDTPISETASIGLYGIGMKRAMFKIGKYAKVYSTTSTDKPFCVTVDVEEWLNRNSEDWDFDIDAAEPFDQTGTVVRINKLNPDVVEEFEDKMFINRLRKTISRDFSLFIRKGFCVTLNGSAIKPYPFGLRVSDGFKPVSITKNESDGVRVVITAGMAAVPPVDDSPESLCSFDPRFYGWYVVCNDRVVLAGDQSDMTVWGDEKFPVWHSQYYGFLGVAMFYCNDAKQLPWTTTKRGVEKSSPLYRRAVKNMKDFTRVWLDYTNARKVSPKEAKRREENAEFRLLGDIEASDKMTLPKMQAEPGVRMTTISYSKPRNDVDRVAKALGDSDMSKKRIGESTFEYFLEREATED